MAIWGQDSISAQTNASLDNQASWIGQGSTFFGRYVDPTASFVAALNYDINRTNTEFAAFVTHSIPVVAIVTTPVASRISSNDYAYGQQDGLIACNAVAKVLDQAYRGKLGSSGFIDIYLDDEPEVPVSLNYWNGWASAVYNYQYAGTYPFWPCCYTNPRQGAANCTTFAQATHPARSIWSYEPEYCNGCYIGRLSYTPWACGAPSTYVGIWQMAIDSECRSCRGSGWPNIDVDQSHPSQDERFYMLSL